MKRKTWFVGKYRVEAWVFCSPYSLNLWGLWPVRIWTYKYSIRALPGWTIAFHGGPVSDAHLKIERVRG